MAEPREVHPVRFFDDPLHATVGVRDFAPRYEKLDDDGDEANDQRGVQSSTYDHAQVEFDQDVPHAPPDEGQGQGQDAPPSTPPDEGQGGAPSREPDGSPEGNRPAPVDPTPAAPSTEKEARAQRPN